MTSSSSIDSQFTPGSSTASGGGDGNHNRRSPPLQQQNYYSQHNSHHNHHQHHHTHPHQQLQQTYGGALVTGSMATTPPTTPPIGNGKLAGGMPTPIPASIGPNCNGTAVGGGTKPVVRTISRNRSTVGRDGAVGKDGSTSLPSRVSQIYYKHGLFLSSYPTCAFSISIALIIFCAYPLMNIPLPGTIPTKVIFPYTEQIGQNLHMTNANSSSGMSEMYNPFSFNGNNIFNIYNISVDPPFPWARIEPLLYVQQIILRSSVVPWTNRNDLQLTDAYRGPLYEVFKLIEIIRNHEDESKTTLSDICLHVENVKRPSQQMLFPEYNCLLLSPANLWQQNIQNFNKDSNLLNTVFVNHNLQKSKVSTSEMLFGISLRDTGVKRYPMRVRSRIIQYAVTLILRENNPEFIKSLKEKLTRTYPLHQPAEDRRQERFDQSSIMYIFYPGEFDWKEFLPQCIAMSMLFLYVYYSVRKIEEIKSRLVLASSAVLTVLGSLLMSLGMCFFFGLTISLQSKGVYPYLVILVGLENVLVITKSVLTTDNNLDVKIRVAQGLSREGWSITKNLLLEITILTIGLCTFVPFIQEFCIFAIVGLISDFFLQMMFFSTVLAFDIKRVEYSAEVRQLPKMLYYSSDRRSEHEGIRNGGISRSMSHPKLSGLDQSCGGGQGKKNSLTTSGNGKDKKIPKRLRIVNFWAKTRWFQRGFMIWMVLWISHIIYNSGLIEFMIDKNLEAQRAAREASKVNVPVNDMHDLRAADAGHLNINHFADGELNSERNPNVTEQLNRLKHPDYETVYQLSNFHWSSILKQYNVSLSGRYVTVLPSIKLSHAVSPQVVQKLRNPDEKAPHHFQWKALAAALDPLDLNDADTGDVPNINTGNAPFYPKTPMEILLSCMLIAVSIFMVTYLLVMLYRCMCTRNYAEWRASWTADSENEQEPKQEQRVLEGVPIQVNGHNHRIECLVTDGNMIASSCLQGQVKIWDVTNGELMAEIHRSNHFDMQRKEGQRSPTGPVLIKNEGNITGMQEIYPEQSPTSFAFKLKKKLQFNFTSSQNPTQESAPQKDPSLFDFAAQYEKNFTTDHHPTSNSQKLRNRFLAGSNPYYEVAATTGGGVGLQHQKSEEQQPPPPGSTARKKAYQTSPIWCLDFLDNLIVIGCADGRLEFWEGTTGNLKGIYETEHTRNNGVTNIKLTGDKVVAARLSGRIDFLRLETYTQGRQIDWGFTSAYRRTHIRTGSAGSLSMFQQNGGPSSGNHHASEEELRCILEFHQQGHQMPVTCLEVAGGTVMTGSQDHTVKVFRLESHQLQFTLHGHCGPISCLFIDQWQAGMGASGCQDGLLCVWDLNRGVCMYKIEAHDDSIVALACSPSYVISLGLDERIRVWDRFQGQPLTTMTVSHAYSSLVMLTPSLLVTGKPGSLIVWDVRTGDAVREVKLDCSNSQLSPKIMLPACGSIICDYGNQMRIVRFPLVAADKCE